MDELAVRSAAYHEKGCNCCQSVLCSLAEHTGLAEPTAVALAVGFGGGMLTGNVCGAVTGGMMAIGLACTAGADSCCCLPFARFPALP